MIYLFILFFFFFFFYRPGVDARDHGGPGKIPPEENIVWAKLQPG